MFRTTALATALGTLFAASPALAGPFPGTSTGPSSSQSPYLVPLREGVFYKSLLTVGDAAGTKPDNSPYRMVGIPDGMGAFDNGNGSFTVLMNHELGATAGIARAHGSRGAFVSAWTVDKATMMVSNGRDQLQSANDLYLFSGGNFTAGTTTAFARFCSADLAPRSAFWNPATGKGYNGLIYMNGEETGAEGRGFAHVVTGGNAGQTWQLPSLGRYSYENLVANGGTGDKTVVAGFDDSGAGQMYIYVGDKKTSNNPIEAAGLTGGQQYAIKVGSAGQNEDRSASANLGLVDNRGSFTLVGLGDVTTLTGAQLETASRSAGATGFLRPEDGLWDPLDARVLYVQTTDQFSQVKTSTGSQVGTTRVWKFTFNDIANPTAGGTVELLIDGTENFGGGPQMLDNLTATVVNGRTQLVLQEDPGNNAWLAKLWMLDPVTKKLTLVSQHDPSRFVTGAPNFLTQDEESSGIIDITALLAGVDGYDTGIYRYFLADVQAHYAISGELVEGGQLLLMAMDSRVPEPGTLALLAGGIGGLAVVRRRRAALTA